MSAAEFEPDLERLSTILAHLPEIVVVADPDGTILYLNRTEEGYRPEDFIGMNAGDLVGEEDRHTFRDRVRALHETGEPQEYEVRVVVGARPEPVELWLRTRMLPFGDIDESGLLLMVSTDMTREKELEHEAEELRRLLPICSWCGRIQGEDGEWSKLQDYVARRERTMVSHGICPTCSEREIEGLADDGDSNGSVA